MSFYHNCSLLTKNKHYWIKFVKHPFSSFEWHLNAYLNRFRSVKRSNSTMSWKAWDISTVLFLVLHVFWRNNMVSAVETPNFKMSQDAFACVADALDILYRADYTEGLDQCVGRLQRKLKMPRPSRTCVFDASSKVAYHLFIFSLLLKNFLTALICYQSCEVNWSHSL